MRDQWPTVDAALRWAHYWKFKTEIWPIKLPSVQRSSPDTSPTAMSPMDGVVQSAMILAFVARELREPERDVVDLLYLVPGTRSLAARKELLARYVGHRIHEQCNRPKWWTVDVLREWSNVTPEHPVDWWANNLGRDRTTLWRWARGRDDRAIYTAVERDLARAIDQLSDKMIDRGLVESSVVGKVCAG